MERLEARLAEVAASHGPVLGEHAGATIAAGGKRLRPLLVFVAAGPPADGDGRRRRCAPRSRSSSSTPPRSSTTTCSTAAPCGAAGRRSSRRRGAAWRRRRATCCSRARSPSWPPTAAPEEIRVLSAASSALAEGELMQRADAWNVDDDARALPGALRPQDRAAVPGGVRARRARGRRPGRAAGAVRPAHRPRLPAARRRARRRRARPSAPASTAAPTCSTARSRCR